MRSRNRDDDAGGAENRKAADDTEARVPGLLRKRHATRNRDRHLKVGGNGVCRAQRFDLGPRSWRAVPG